MVLIIAFGLGLVGLYHLYEVFVKGEMVLKNAPGHVTVTREGDTQIPHIRGDSEESIAYAQGFTQAQSRLWQMEKMRRVGRGSLCEIFGEAALPVDEFMRHVGLRRSAQEAWE